MQETKKRVSRNVIIVAFVALASGFGQDLITPILPGFLLALGLNKANIGLIDGLLQGTTSIFRFISGLLSDRLRNRKALVFFGYALSAISRPLLALTGSFASIAFLRIVDGAGKGTKDAPRDALIADSSEGVSGRAFGFHRLVDTAGSVLGPLLASAILLLFTPALSTYRFIFAMAIAPGAVALALIYFGIKEPATREREKITTTKPLPWQFWLFAIAASIVMLTKVNDSLFLVRASDLGIASSYLPAIFAGFTLLYAALSYPIGILSDRFGKLPMIATGWLVLSLVELGFSANPNIETVLVLFAFYGLYFALTEGSGRALIADLVSPESRGSAYAIFHTFIGLAVIFGGYGLGRLWDAASPTVAFKLSAFGAIVGSLMIFWLVLKNKRQHAIG